MLHFSQGAAQNPTSHACAAGHHVFSAGDAAKLWRVDSGVLRMFRRDAGEQLLVSLATAGDLVGIESLCGQAHQLSAQALTDVVLAPLQPHTDTERQQLMMLALLQHQQRSHDMALLRTGPVLPRMVQLLKLLGHASALLGHTHDADTLRSSLPVLRELASVVDAKPETVCRALAQLLPPRTRKTGPRTWAVAGAAAAQALGLLANPGMAANGAMA